jgi:hypothetical protein
MRNAVKELDESNLVSDNIDISIFRISVFLSFINIEENSAIKYLSTPPPKNFCP